MACFVDSVRPCAKYFVAVVQAGALRFDSGGKDGFVSDFQHPEFAGFVEDRKPGMMELAEMEAQVVVAIEVEAAVNADYPVAGNLVVGFEEADGWLEGGEAPVVAVVTAAVIAVARAGGGILVVPVATGSEDIVAAADAAVAVAGIVSSPVVPAIVAPAAAAVADDR